MAYYDFPLELIWEKWQQQGGQFYELIEPIDGFHPSQIANYLMPEVLWPILLKSHPNFLGKENPNNSLIEKLFGDQGGY